MKDNNSHDWQTSPKQVKCCLTESLIGILQNDYDDKAMRVEHAQKYEND